MELNQLMSWGFEFLKLVGIPLVLYFYNDLKKSNDKLMKEFTAFRSEMKESMDDFKQEVKEELKKNDAKIDKVNEELNKLKIEIPKTYITKDEIKIQIKDINESLIRTDKKIDRLVELAQKRG